MKNVAIWFWRALLAAPILFVTWVMFFVAKEGGAGTAIAAAWYFLLAAGVLDLVARKRGRRIRELEQTIQRERGDRFIDRLRRP